MKRARQYASASVGTVITLGSQLTSTSVQRKLRNHFIPVVGQHLSTVHFRVQKCYGLALAAAELVSNLCSAKMH